jgi:hypothetical protein
MWRHHALPAGSLSPRHGGLSRIRRLTSATYHAGLRLDKNLFRTDMCRDMNPSTSTSRASLYSTREPIVNILKGNGCLGQVSNGATNPLPSRGPFKKIESRRVLPRYNEMSRADHGTEAERVFRSRGAAAYGKPRVMAISSTSHRLAASSSSRRLLSMRRPNLSCDKIRCTCVYTGWSNRSSRTRSAIRLRGSGCTPTAR